MADKFNLSDMVDHSGGWNWEDSHVAQAYSSPHGIDSKASIAINDIIESGTVLIAAGPADLDKAVENGSEGVRIVPIGLIESAQISMSKPLSRIFEIGSKLSYIIPGKTVGGIGISRVFFDGPSLLKALYFGEVRSDYATEKNKYAKFVSNPNNIDGEDSYQKFANIGSGNMAMNLASSFFDQPVGLAFYFKDQQNDEVGQIYLEGCRVSTYNIGISSSMNVLTEAVNMEFVRCRPILTATSQEYEKGNNIADLNIVSARSNTGNQ
jgi:hypothetical protein